MDSTSLSCSCALSVFWVGLSGLSAKRSPLWPASWLPVVDKSRGSKSAEVQRYALADAYQFAGGPVPDRGLVLGRGSFLARTVRLGGPKVRKARRNFADPLEGSDVFMS